MENGVRQALLISGGLAITLLLSYYAYSHPWYFTNQSYLTGLIGFQLLLAAIWLYRKLYFPLVLMAFLFAGSNLPVGGGWGAARWIILGVGAAVGILIFLREHRYRFTAFHGFALLASLTALASATVSLHPEVVLLKGLSLALLFAYAGTGIRVAAGDRPGRFFAGLLLGTEIFFALLAALDLAGINAMGNPNSLGGAASMVGVPILLWGTLNTPPSKLRHLRLLLFGVSMFLTFTSRARAGIGAALIVSGLLCFMFRRYRAMAQGAVVILMFVAIAGLLWPQALPSMTSEFVYKGSEADKGILASRTSPWSEAIENIKQHLLFGTGLGTTTQGKEPPIATGMFASTSSVTAEHGSSYLALLAGVGIAGAIPFALMIGLLIQKLFRMIIWARASGEIAHPAIPLGMVIVAGFIHAAFEDWMFAPGSYFCVFFWCMAFLFVDFSPVVPTAMAERFRSPLSAAGPEFPNRVWPSNLPQHYS